MNVGEVVTKRDLLSLCGKLVGQYPVGGLVESGPIRQLRRLKPDKISHLQRDIWKRPPHH